MDGTILSWNKGAEEIFGYAADEIVGKSIRTLIPDDLQAEEDGILASIVRGERVPRFETVRLRKDGSFVPLSVTVSPVRNSDGEVVAASKIAHDLSDSKRLQRQVEETEGRFRLLADNISQLAWIADKNGHIFWYNKRWFDFTGTTLEQMQGWGWQSVHHPDEFERVHALWKRHLETGEEWEDTFPLRGADGEYRWFLSRALPIRDDRGDIVCWFGTNTDVTDMRDAEQRIELLLREVNHRAKNMLAIVQSLARSSDVSREGFIDRFEQRIQALAANQDLLVNRAWARVPVRELVEAQLAFLSDSLCRCEYSGPDILLAPSSVEVLSMAIHELATNALKHGALSDDKGRLEVVWRVEREDERDLFVMEWRESDGPAVREPSRRGFGSRIIIDVPRLRLNAAVACEFAPTGFTWTLSCPLADIA